MIAGNAASAKNTGRRSRWIRVSHYPGDEASAFPALLSRPPPTLGIRMSRSFKGVIRPCGRPVTEPSELEELLRP